HQTSQVTPFGNPGITVQLATPPSISQPHTSLIDHPAPRHPPCALHNLTEHQSTQLHTKTLTHTTQISNNTPAAPHTTQRRNTTGPETYCLRTPTGCKTHQPTHKQTNRPQG